MGQEKEFDPSKNPGARLFQHITIKGIQLGSLLGCGIVLPILAMRGYLKNRRLDFGLANKALTYSTMTGTTSSWIFGLGSYMILEKDRDGLEDRVYRLYYNELQNRCDKFSLIFGLLGCVSAPILTNYSIYTILGGFSSGIAFGTMAHVVTSSEMIKKLNIT